jgi:hypothetical protein
MKNYPVLYKKNEIVKKEESSNLRTMKNNKYKTLKFLIFIFLWFSTLLTVSGIYNWYKSRLDYEQIKKELNLKYHNDN